MFEESRGSFDTNDILYCLILATDIFGNLYTSSISYC